MPLSPESKERVMKISDEIGRISRRLTDACGSNHAKGDLAEIEELAARSGELREILDESHQSDPGFSSETELSSSSNV